MDTKTLIDDLIRDHEHLDPADTDNTNLRLQLLKNTKRTVKDIRGRQPWTWCVVPATSPSSVVLTVSGDVDLPANFQDFGHYGTVHAQVGGGTPDVEIIVRPLQEVLHYRRLNRTRQYPLLCAVNGINTTTHRKVLSTAPVIPTGTLTLLLTFDILTAAIVDQVDPGSGLSDVIPEEWHESALYEGVVMRQMKDKGDIRSASEQRGIYEAAIKAMVLKENPMRGQINRMPPFPLAGMAFRY